MANNFIRPPEMISGQLFTNTRKEHIKYEYPDGLDLKPGSPLHKKLVSIVSEYANSSSESIYARRASWKKIERNLTSYIPLDDAEKSLKESDDRKPIRIVIPLSFATLETLLT